MTYSELSQRESTLDKIQQKTMLCCELRVKLLEDLHNRKRGETNEEIFMFLYVKRVLTKFSLIRMNNELCPPCEDLRKELIKFVNNCEKNNI